MRHRPLPTISCPTVPILSGFRRNFSSEQRLGQEALSSLPHMTTGLPHKFWLLRRCHEELSEKQKCSGDDSEVCDFSEISPSKASPDPVRLVASSSRDSQVLLRLSTWRVLGTVALTRDTACSRRWLFPSGDGRRSKASYRDERTSSRRISSRAFCRCVTLTANGLDVKVGLSR